MPVKSIDKAVIEELKAKHPSLRILTVKIPGDDGVPEAFEFAVRKPRGAEVKRYLKQINNQETRADAYEALTTACVVYPDIEAELEENYGLAVTIANELGAWSGISSSGELKKA